MMETLIAGIVGFVVACILIGVIAWMRRGGGTQPAIAVSSTLESLRAVGELVVLKVYTQQIVTRTDHLFGDWGEKWLAWLVSSKKMAMIFDFVVDFRYNLKSNMFNFRAIGEDKVEIQLPPCFYEIQMRNIQIYDERAAEVVPFLLPGFLAQILGGKFSEKDKNELIHAARQEADGMARQLSERMAGEAQRSAEVTLGSIARGAGFAEAVFKFLGTGPVAGAIDLSQIESSLEKAIHP